MDVEGDLRRRFGRFVQAHRRRMRMTQEALAAKAELSSDMITRIEAGSTGARFPSIERIASALNVDPAELFTNEIPSGTLQRTALVNLTARLAALSDQDLRWVAQLLDAALKPRP